MAAKRRKTAWYMMGIVSFIVALIILFLPLDPEKGYDGDTLFTSAVSGLRVNQSKQKNDQETKIILGGDVMLGRSVMATSLDKNDFNYPFLNIAARLRLADGVFVNLENAIVEDCPKVYSNTLKFCGLPEMLKGLDFAEIDVVTLANNHSRNYGEEGLAETKRHLDNYGILYTDNNLATKEINNINFGFVGFDYTVNEPTEDDYKLVKDSIEKVDYLIVAIHWGVEYTREPRIAQREWAQKFVESGADFIAGHHPHWVQINEEINGVPVYYSLGNLVFDQMWSEETKKGLLIELVFDKRGKLEEINEINTYMEDWAQPMIVASENN